MTWRNLLFAHWPVDAEVLRRLIPPGLELDLFAGTAYVGVVPFLMDHVTPRGTPPVPGLHSFPELNLRTYVTAAGKPGVWFFSLDAGQKLAVRVARKLFHLPYYDAKFAISEGDGQVSYRAERTHRNAARAEFLASYGPVGEVYSAPPGSLDDWLTARFCLYSAAPSGALYRGDIEHEKWPLQPADAHIETNTLGDWLGISLTGAPRTLHFAKAVHVHAWRITRI